MPPVSTLTASDIVKTKAHIDGQSSEGLKAARLRFQNLAAKGYFFADDDASAGATTAKRYRKRELARAAVLIDALEAGAESAFLAAIAAALNEKPNMMLGHAPSADVGGSYVYGTGIESAIRGVLADDPGKWLLEFSAGREGDKIVHTAAVAYVPPGEAQMASDLALLRSPIFTGAIDLTARLAPFGWMLREA